jgi:transglutaminase-like putative cysteine protease
MPSNQERNRFLLVLCCAAAICVALRAAAGGAERSAAAPAHSRTFLFTYGGTVTGLAAGQNARVWLPVPPSNEDQNAALVSRQIPGNAQVHRDPKEGNGMLYFETKADADGKVPFSVTYRITRREVKEDKQADEEGSLARYLQPDSKVPVDGKPLGLLKGKTVPRDQMAAARTLYDIVDDHMRYSKEGTGWGRGDAVWACESGYGNCTDFHSLFIALARSQKIPAKFEIGFPLPAERGAGDIAGYHCWAKFRPDGKGWIPVDISEANKNPKLRDYYFGTLSPDRVAFSTGRDLNLFPQQDGPPLNFFIYPYVEVDGKPYPADKIKRAFSYKDVGPETGK